MSSLNLNKFFKKGKIRLLKIILEFGTLNITQLATKAGMNHSSVNHHLNELAQMGLVQEKQNNKTRSFEATFNVLKLRFGKQGLNIEIS